MKKIFFLTMFAIQFSLCGFSQSDAMHHYTDAEVSKLSAYVKGLEAKQSTVNVSEADKEVKKQIADLFNRTQHDYADAEIIKLTAYIKHLENPKAFAAVPTTDSLTHFTNPEIEKFADYIKVLEKRNSAAGSLQADPEEKRKIAELLRIPSHEFTDGELVMLADYIKHMEKLDSLNAIAAVKVHNDSTALTLAKVTEPIKEYHLEEEKEINKIEKLIFFNFNSASLKAESFKPLDDVVKILKSYVNLNFIVEGYCDSIGSAAYNLSLSKKRASSVKNYFISKGIPASRISAVGYGKDKPIDTNETEAGRAKNRRVEIKAKQ